MKQYLVKLAEDAEQDLDDITDQRTYRAIERRIDELSTEPSTRGKPLTGEFKGL